MYWKTIQLLYKSIREIGGNAMIVKYKGVEEEITEANNSGIAVKVKHAMLNFTETVP